MERHDVLAMMTALKLAGMRAAYDDILADGLKRRHPVQQIIGTLLQVEIADKTARSIKYQMASAKLPTAKELADFDFAASPVNEPLIQELAGGGFLDAAGPEVHRPGGAQRQRNHIWPEGLVVGVHTDPLAGAVLVDDALFGPPAVEEGQKSVGDRLGPPREGGRRGVAAGTAVPVIVTEAIVLHATAEIGEPGRLGDAQQDAPLLGLGDDVGDESGPLVEDVHRDVLAS